MLVLFTIKEPFFAFTLEICQSQYQKEVYFAVVINISKVVWTQVFNNRQTAEQKGKAMFRAFCLTDKYLDLSEKAYKQAKLAQEDGELVKAALFLRRAFFYRERHQARRDMGLWIE